jgi:hypothetical protein
MVKTLKPEKTTGLRENEVEEVVGFFMAAGRYVGLDGGRLPLSAILMVAA